ncbi:hypothetical protein CR513_30763, partial [Mucuna pruriens]
MLVRHRKPLFTVPTNMVLHVFSFVIVVRAGKNIMLKEFQDVFPKDVPHGLPPLRGIKHHLDLTLGVTLHNGTTYRINLGEAKEINKQVAKLIEIDIKQVMEGFELGIHGKQMSVVENKVSIDLLHHRALLHMEKGDLVWVHLRKEQFLHLRKSKLLSREDDPFKAIKK